jgi:hypothetical protein
VGVGSGVGEALGEVVAVGELSAAGVPSSSPERVSTTTSAPIATRSARSTSTSVRVARESLDCGAGDCAAGHSGG